jgi:thioredoxin reductase
MFDVVIIGGGPAGLNAALILGRVGRPVLLADDGQPRNAASPAVHGFLSRDGADPAELRRTAREELTRYPSIQARNLTVQAATATQSGFELTLADGTTTAARRVLLATGVTDQLPGIAGLADLWGRGVYHCPYCHGWEVRGRQIVVLGADDPAAQLALNLARLDCEVILCTDGPLQASEPARQALAARGITTCEDPVLTVEGRPHEYVRLHLAPGQTLEPHAVFLQPARRQHSELAHQLGCALLEDGSVQVDELGQTTVPGVYAAGDMCRTPAMPAPAAQVIMAAAQGARAAVVIDQELLFAGANPTQRTDPPAGGEPPTAAGTVANSSQDTS